MSDKSKKGTGKGSNAPKSVSKKAPAKKTPPKPQAGSRFEPKDRLRFKVVQIAADFQSVDIDDLVVRPGDLVEWRSANGDPFVIRFKGSKAESADESGRRSIPANAGRVLMVVRERKKGEIKPELKYDVVSEKGTLDPKVIIDPMAQ